MKNNLFFILAILLFASSCSKDVLPEDIAEENVTEKEANSMLNIRTRTGTNAEGDALVSYPVNVYVFDDNSACISYSVLSSSEDVLSLDLVEGSYTIYSVAGADDTKYSIPTQENATAESVVELIDGNQHSDIMTSKNVVNLVDGEENTLTLSMERKVMELEEVKINNVPTTTTAVIVDIAPLYQNICINGEYNGDNGLQSIEMTNETGTKTWSNSESMYLMPASSDATITIKMTDDEGTKSYSYTCADELIANYKIKIEGTYTGKAGVTLTGTITGATWAGEKTITFEFDEDGSNGDTTTDNNEETGGEETGGNDGDEGDDVVASNVPAVGTFYENCYVLKHDVNESDNTTTVTLLSTTAMTLELSDEQENQTSIKTLIDNSLSSFAVSGISGWRLINAEELAYIKDNLAAINTAFTDVYNTSQAFIDGGNTFYYYQKDENNIMIFKFVNGVMSEYNPSGKNQLRPVTTVVFSNSQN